MGDWHMDSECERALVRLDDALCEFERNTDRECTLILVPHTPDEAIFISQSGKPLPTKGPMGYNPEEILEIAMRKRGG